MQFFRILIAALPFLIAQQINANYRKVRKYFSAKKRDLQITDFECN